MISAIPRRSRWPQDRVALGMVMESLETGLPIFVVARLDGPRSEMLSAHSEVEEANAHAALHARRARGKLKIFKLELSEVDICAGE